MRQLVCLWFNYPKPLKSVLQLNCISFEDRRTIKFIKGDVDLWRMSCLMRHFRTGNLIKIFRVSIKNFRSKAVNKSALLLEELKISTNLVFNQTIYACLRLGKNIFERFSQSFLLINTFTRNCYDQHIWLFFWEPSWCKLFAYITSSTQGEREPSMSFPFLAFCIVWNIQWTCWSLNILTKASKNPLRHRLPFIFKD